MPASFQTVGLVGRSQQDGLEPVLDELLELLKERGATVLVEDRLADISPDESLTRCSVEQIGEQADLVIVIGGDGSLLGAARTLARFDIWGAYTLGLGVHSLLLVTLLPAVTFVLPTLTFAPPMGS